MPAIGKKLHHYVPRFYLKAWAQKNQIHCLQDGRIFRPNVQGVASQNYFYRLEEITAEDAKFIRYFIDQSPAGLKNGHEELLQALMLPHALRRRLQEMGTTAPELERLLEQAIVEMNENLHTAVEDDFRRHLEAMRIGDLSFLQDEKQTVLFYRGLSVQYARTNHIKQSERSMPPESFARYMRIANPLVHIVAINVGRSLFAERHHHTIALIDNPSPVPFVTADQPVINVAANPTDYEPPEKFELYYPISPTKAMLLVEPGSEHNAPDPITESYAQIMNLRMAAHSYRQVFAKAPHQLETIREEMPAFLRCFRTRPSA